MAAVKCESLLWVSECCGWVIKVLLLFSLSERVKIKSARIEDSAESLFWPGSGDVVLFFGIHLDSVILLSLCGLPHKLPGHLIPGRVTPLGIG